MEKLKEFSEKGNVKEFPKYFEEFILNKRVKLEDVANIYKIFRKYSIIMRTRKGETLRAFENSLFKNTIEHKILQQLIKYHQDYNRYEIKKIMTNIVNSSVDKVGSEIFDLFKDIDTINFFNSKREDDFFHLLVNWFFKSLYDEEIIYCEECMSLMVPNFTKADTYFCSNGKCPNSSMDHYNNHCWNCGDIIDSDYNYQCKNCNWYICNDCNSCAQGNKCEETVPIKRRLKSVVKINSDRKLILDNFYKQIARKYQNNKRLQRIIVNTRRGKKILENDFELELYLASYFKMHLIKMREAISIGLKDINTDRISIYDWGCGQAIGTLSLLEYFFHDNKLEVVESINLIEPSKKALDNGVKFINELFNKEKKIKINLKNAAFEHIENDFGIKRNKGIAIHLFSNILDVDFDLVNLKRAIDNCLSEEHNLFVCISPYYVKAKKRIDQFAELYSTKTGFREISTEDKSIKTEIFNLIKKKNTSKIVKRYHKIFEVKN